MNAKNLVKNLMRRKFYARPDDTNRRIFQVLKMKRTKEDVHMLARFDRGSDYVVFSFWTKADLHTHYPSDKWAGSLRAAKEMFNEICARHE